MSVNGPSGADSSSRATQGGVSAGADPDVADNLAAAQNEAAKAAAAGMAATRAFAQRMPAAVDRAADVATEAARAAEKAARAATYAAGRNPTEANLEAARAARSVAVDAGYSALAARRAAETAEKRGPRPSHQVDPPADPRNLITHNTINQLDTIAVNGSSQTYADVALGNRPQQS
ncbi:hypothetical protein [Lysobacter sp. CA199]|uniref:hypothetical protein n=1 Tax=Lysobacter sp. CA199 TaxID=3455608 RepID=UPI003F8D3136